MLSQDPTALRGGIGEKSLRQILAQADRVADRSLPPDREAIRKLSGDISSMTDALCELRQDGKGTTPQVRQLWDAVCFCHCIVQFVMFGYLYLFLHIQKFFYQ